MKTLRFFKYVGFGILGIGFVALAILLTMSLWNHLVPTLFNGPVLTYWQTAGLFLLSKILLTGIAPGNHSKSHKKEWLNYRKYKDFGPHHPKEEDEAVPQQ